MSDNGTSTETFPRKIPVIPPFTNVTMNPRHHNITVLSLILPLHKVKIQLYTFIAVGTAMISVVVAKKNPNHGFIPLTYMWWAQTKKLKAPIATTVSPGV